MVPKAAAIPMHPPSATIAHSVNLDDRTSSPPPDQHTRPTRPTNNRSSTDPSPTPSLLLQGYFKDKDNNVKDWARPSSSHRNRSPYSRSHLRSRSSGAVAGLPLMTRAHSSPSPYIPRVFSDTPPAGSASPMRTPARTRSPFLEESGGIESIQEDSELDLRPRSQQSGLVQPTALRASRVPSGGRRRPASPLSNIPFSQPPPPHPQAPTSFPTEQNNATAASHSASSSPSLPPQKEKYYNEAYPSSPASTPFTLHHHSSTSSMASFASSLNSSLSYPGTPTSARSRSPSISSLDTIEDEPEMEVMEKLREDAEEEEGGARRSSLEEKGSGGARVGVGFGFTRGRSERKRWSVCGGERRGDLDLETIWED